MYHVVERPESTEVEKDILRDSHFALNKKYKTDF